MEGKLCFLSKASIAWIFSQIASVDSFEKGERVLPAVFLLLQSALDLESSQWRWFYIETLPKAQRTRGLSSSYQSNFLRPYHKFKHKSWSHIIFRISTKHQLKISTKHQHIHATQNSKSWPNLAAESRPRFNFITSTKHQRQNAEQTAASNLAWTSTSKSWPTLVLKVWTKV